jgi:hypothetical protein
VNGSYRGDEEFSGNSEGSSWIRATESGGMMVQEEEELEDGDDEIGVGETGGDTLGETREETRQSSRQMENAEGGAKR